jgi:hypothetical protein
MGGGDFFKLNGDNDPDKKKKVKIAQYKVDNVRLIVILCEKISIPVVIDYVLINNKSSANQTDNKHRPAR